MEGSDDKPRDRAAKHSPLSQPSSAFQKKKKKPWLMNLLIAGTRMGSPGYTTFRDLDYFVVQSGATIHFIGYMQKTSNQCAA